LLLAAEPLLPQHRRVSANGITHHYLEWGDPAAPPLLMVHGTGHCAQVWSYAARALSDEFHVLSIDQRGHGDTETPPTGFTFEDLARDLLAVIDELDLEQVNVVGHSSGGLATLIADSWLPGIIDRAVLAEVVIQRTEGASGPNLPEVAARTRSKRTVWESRQAMYDYYRRRPAYQPWDAEVFGNFIEGIARELPDGSVELKCGPEVEARFYEDRASLDMLAYIVSCRSNYLLLLGNYSGPQAQTLDSQGVRRFQELVPSTQIKPMGVGTHFLPMEHPALVVHEIRNFLG
jgi:pimeloyl-ACP methyl ester carboxylesterase